jgi:hypothetical protein
LGHVGTINPLILFAPDRAKPQKSTRNCRTWVPKVRQCFGDSTILINAIKPQQFLAKALFFW